MWQGVEFKE